jgi:hypothetical protein
MAASIALVADFWLIQTYALLGIAAAEKQQFGQHMCKYRTRLLP